MLDTLHAAQFRRLGLLTIFAVYLVILAGSIVRASGAGMGCPDWPTCFGQWIPPTDESQLPADYHDRYAARGYKDTTFNPLKTWTEYGNRLIGATTGLLVLATAWAARRFRKIDPPVFYLAVTVLLLIGFQGWLGSAVVASNLKPLMITAHMLLALIIVALLIYAIIRSQKQQLQAQGEAHLPERFATVLNIALAMTLLQIAMGTQVRETIDFIAKQHGYIAREFWRDSFPIIFYVHRSFSSLILFTNTWLVWQIFQSTQTRHLLRKIGSTLMALIVTAILAGVSLDRLGFPAVAQPIHLLMANLIFGAQFFLFSAYRYGNSASQ
jgi:heme a synthase